MSPTFRDLPSSFLFSSRSTTPSVVAARGTPTLPRHLVEERLLKSRFKLEKMGDCRKCFWVASALFPQRSNARLEPNAMDAIGGVGRKSSGFQRGVATIREGCRLWFIQWRRSWRIKQRQKWWTSICFFHFFYFLILFKNGFQTAELHEYGGSASLSLAVRRCRFVGGR